MLEVKPEVETFAKIKVIGVGGSGGSAVNRMIQAKIKGVEFATVNTDLQALQYSLAPIRLHIGKTITRGLGAGMDPDMGRKSAEESQNEIRDLVKGADMVFITCGLGGGTGSGAGPVVAEIARDAGALVVGVVTKPFSFEGKQRREIAERAFAELQSKVDTIITIPNDSILHIADKKTPLLQAFDIVDDVLRQGVQGIAEIITVPGLINVDFADVRAIMSHAGSALMGIGRAEGENRAVEAAKAAIMNPLIEVSIDGAKGILFTIAGDSSLTFNEVNDAAKVITDHADSNAKVIFGAIIDESLKNTIKITVIAAGFNPKERDAFASSSQELPPPLVRHTPSSNISRTPITPEPVSIPESSTTSMGDIAVSSASPMPQRDIVTSTPAQAPVSTPVRVEPAIDWDRPPVFDKLNKIKNKAREEKAKDNGDMPDFIRKRIEP